MLATNMSEAGSPEEKLRWAFKMYDRDGSGIIFDILNVIKIWFEGGIEVDEMVEIVCNLYELEGLSKV